MINSQGGYMYRFLIFVLIFLNSNVIFSQMLVKDDAGTVLMRVTGRGLVGIDIGNIIPRAKLDVGGDLRLATVDQLAGTTDAEVLVWDNNMVKRRTLGSTIWDGDNQNLSQVLAVGNDANDQAAVNFSHLSVNSTDTTAKIVVEGTEQHQFPYSTGFSRNYAGILSENFTTGETSNDNYTSIQSIVYNNHDISTDVTTIAVHGAAMRGTDPQQVISAAYLSAIDTKREKITALEGVIYNTASRAGFRTHAAYLANGNSGTDDYNLYAFGDGSMSGSKSYFAGRVGIGVEQPNSSFRLHSKGSIFIDGAEMTNGAGLWINNGDINASGTITCDQLVETSDVRYKKDVHTLSDALDTVSRLRGVSFHWDRSKVNIKKEKSIGLIADEVEQVLPELVQKVDGHKALSYSKLTAVLIEAVKELDAKNRELEQKVAQLLSENH
ncbi:hypothetical protein GF407_20250 [candidate division KSB1 bacterium]|nr:hypothetical protein [candidate division KSB1 bacterium]